MQRTLVVALCGLLTACGSSTPTTDNTPDNTVRPSDGAPVAAQKPHTVTSPHGDRSDPYYWLRDDTRKNPEVLAYLNAENAYTDKHLLTPTKALQDTLFKEIVGRLKQDDSTVPTLSNGYYYNSRYETGGQYPIHARRKGSATATEQVLFDVNALAKGHSFYRLGNYAVSEDNKLVAYAEDVVGRNKYTLRVKDLATGKLLADTIKDVTPALVWHNDNKSFFYVGKEAKTLRSYRVYRHVLGTAQKDDALIYEESDKSYYTGIGKSKSRKFVTIRLSSTTTSEVRLIDASAKQSKPVVFLPRKRDHEYSVDHLDGRFVIRTNWQAKNFRLMEVAEAAHNQQSQWKQLVAHSDDFIHGFAVYRNFFAVNIRTNGLRKVLVAPRNGKRFFIDANESAYAMYLSDTPDPDATAVRYAYTSLTTPTSQYEHDIKTGKRTLLKRQPVLGGYKADDYVTEQIIATARDGAKVPVSVVRRKTTKLDGSAPALLIGYGSYGATIDPSFNSRVVSLLDRGFVYAILHIRGSQKFGRSWYEAGKLLNKRNTFNDFVDATKHLIASKYAAASKVFALGGSAGGLLMGAIVNQAPELYRGIISHVPFVDVVTTMLDESIPLTTNEFDEWGNPKVKKYYDYMLGYSPYDQVAAKAYPSMLITTGLWDSQVQYWEPAKWVAKLRKLKTDRNRVLFHINMTAGHGGKSGRFRRFRETARDYAFVLHTLKQADKR